MAKMHKNLMDVSGMSHDLFNFQDTSAMTYLVTGKVELEVHELAGRGQ